MMQNDQWTTPTPDTEDHPIYYHYIPRSQLDVKQTLIGILDASASMAQVWPAVARGWNGLLDERMETFAITFSEVPKIGSKHLMEDLPKHGGFQTDIIKALQGLIQLMKSGRVSHRYISILFISDCEDSRLSTFSERLNNLGLAEIFRNYFPTKGQLAANSIPGQIKDAIIPYLDSLPLYINGERQHQFLQYQFDTLQALLKHEPCVFLDRKQIFPWRTTNHSFVAQHQSWIMSHHYKLQYTDESGTFKSAGQLDLTLNQFSTIVTQYTGMLRTQSLSNKIVSQIQETITFFESLHHIISKPVGPRDQSVLNRRLALYSADQEVQAKRSLQSLNRLLAHQELINHEDDILKKRSAIHTQEGKFHMKLIRFSGLSFNRYRQMRDSFIQLLKTRPCSDNSSQEASIISLQNQMNVLMEQDLVKGLSECENQYELIQCFPLVGMSLHVARSNASQICPFKIEVISIPRHHKALDSISLLQKGYNMKFELGEGEFEQVNCILPLFDGDELKEFLRSDIYHLLMTYNVFLNADVFSDTAYMALLAKTLVHLTTLPESDWRNEVMHKIRKTFIFVYGEDEQVKTVRKLLLPKRNLQNLFFRKNSVTGIDCYDPAFVMLIAFSYQLLSDEVAEYYAVEIYSNSMKRFKIKHILTQAWMSEPLKQLSNRSEIQSLIQRELDRQIAIGNLHEHYYTWKDLNIDLFDTVMSILQSHALLRFQPQNEEDIRSSFERLFLQSAIKTLSATYRYCTGKNFTHEKIIEIYNHCVMHPWQAERLSNPVVPFSREMMARLWKFQNMQQIVSWVQPSLLRTYWKQYKALFLKSHKGMKTVPCPILNMQRACASEDCFFRDEIKKKYPDHILPLLSKSSWKREKNEMAHRLNELYRSYQLF